MDHKRKALNDDLPSPNGISRKIWVMSTDPPLPPPATPHDDYSPRDTTGCPAWFGSTANKGETEFPEAKRIKNENYTSRHEVAIPDESDSELHSATPLDSSPTRSEDEYSEPESYPKPQALFPPPMLFPVDFPNSERASKRRTKRKRARDSDDEDQNYVDGPNSDVDEYDFDAPGVIERAERDDVVFILSREKAKRMAQAVKVPEDTKMGNEEKSLYLDLATRGCYPVLPSDWKKDFATLPESLFPTGDEEIDESNFPFAVQKGSNFYAITALHEILKVPGRVRDCRLLTVRPQDVVKRAIRRYLRWAMTDAGLKKKCKTTAVYKIVVQGQKESTLQVVQRVIARLERLAKKHQDMYNGTKDPYWPTLVAFCLCGPIVTILSVDTDPGSATWVEENSNYHAKYMGQFDMSEDDQDVWNSLALAIAVIHIRRTMARLADQYPNKDGVAQRRRQGDSTDDEDL
ncbi:hypothetical protein PMG11_07233 [Penicillium brasilianum]|uniref:Uncharacterized protein n=1 Tax=Penicillium brasilianum TaxID=104259 RepID=A0A0F7TT25_PENBI|nr:hypothetical protein PMG11_07233 [Penicillium brasilianum]